MIGTHCIAIFKIDYDKASFKLQNLTDDVPVSPLWVLFRQSKSAFFPLVDIYTFDQEPQRRGSFVNFTKLHNPLPQGGTGRRRELTVRLHLF